MRDEPKNKSFSTSEILKRNSFVQDSEITIHDDETLIPNLLDSLALVNSDEDLVLWVNENMQLVFPHGAFIFGVGKVECAGVKPIKFVTSNFPIDYFRSLAKSNGLYYSSVVKLWLETNEVQLFNDENFDEANLDPGWLQNFKNSGLRNIAAYGIYDSFHKYASYFSFHQIPGHLGAYHRRLIKIFVPSLHATFLRILNNTKAGGDKLRRGGTLTPREIEILNWVSTGKTSNEIAFILGISGNTIRNHIQKILIKLRVSTRSQAVSKAIDSQFITGFCAPFLDPNHSRNGK